MTSREQYMGAWLAYVAFSFLACPFLSITAMLFSIPVAMLGGWLYGFRGAVATIALTAIYHYLMLHAHSGDFTFAAEAFNPFGLATQACFAFGAAYAGVLHRRHLNLAATLERRVEERTRSLRQATDRLIAFREIEQASTVAVLMAEPLLQVGKMLGLAKRLELHLAGAGHPGVDGAQRICSMIGYCENQLHSLDRLVHPLVDASGGIEACLDRCVRHLRDRNGVQAKLAVEGSWDGLDDATIRQLCQIACEAATNALRHAGSTEIMVRFRGSGGIWSLGIENNGAPFPSAFREGMGLPLMRHRAHRIGASLAILSDPGRNTVVRCDFPAGRLSAKILSRAEPSR